MRIHKVKSLLVTLTISLMLVACTSNITYTKEFEYLPQVNGMESTTYEKAEQGEMSKAIYSIENEKYDVIIKRYEKNMIKDGWKVTEDNKPNLITLEKGEHKAVIISKQVDNNVELTILSK